MTDSSQKEQHERSQWPVVLERTLLRAERRLWRRYRSPDLLPVLQPGCVYVFGGRDGHRAWDVDAVLRGTDPVYVEAGTVSVVDTRYRRIQVWMGVPTTEIATDLSVCITFGCTVQDAAEAARAGWTDLRGELERQVRRAGLVEDDHGPYALDDLVTARRRIPAVIGGMYGTQSPRLDGMRIAFEGAVVHLPRELRRHQTQLRDTRWALIEHREKHAAERKRVEDAEHDLLCTPERAEATAVTREERTADQAASRQFQERDTRVERLIEQYKALVDADGAKRTPVDRRRIMEAVFDELLDGPPRERQSAAIVEVPAAATNGRAAVDITSYLPPDDVGER